MNNISFPYYSGYIKFTKVIGHVSILEFIKAHENPKPETLKTILKIKEADNNNDKKLKRILKQKLYSFTPSIMIKKGLKRSYENIDHYTGIIQLDFDKLDGKKNAEDLKYYLFQNYTEIICSYFSPSYGVKCLLNIIQPVDKDHYKAIYKAVESEFEIYDGFDNSTKNAVLPLFLSVDKEILYRENPKTWIKEDWSEIDYKELNTPPPNFKPSFNESDYNKTIRIFNNKINQININGHPQLRNACLILGSRAGAGYIDLSQCFIIAENKIKENNYFHKDLNNYIKTSVWSINQGYKNSKKYK